MRIVIADDEYLVQETLVSMIAECDDGWSIVGVASDGKELVDLIIQLQPNLVIVDIKMPYISGIEAIRLTRNEYPFMQWIVLTGYSEFIFAQEALKLGATNYLLKPIEFSEFKNALETLKKVLIEQNAMLNKRFESAMNLVCHGLSSGLTKAEDQALLVLNFEIISFYMDSGLNEIEQACRLKSFYHQVKVCMHEEVNSNIKSAFIFLPKGELALIYAYKQDAKSTKIFNNVMEQIETIIHEMIGAEFCLTMISTGKLNYAMLKEQIDTIQTVSLFRIIYGLNKNWTLQQLEKDIDKEANKLCKTIAKLVKNFHEGSHANYMNQINELKVIMEAAERFNEKNRTAIFHFIYSTIQCQLDEKSSLAEWIQKLKDHGHLLLNQVSKVERPQGIVQQILLFIENNYMKDISIVQIADELQLTPNYLSTVFHKKLGMTFLKYLTKIRLIKAQELLRNSNLQVQVVAEMVGYMNPRYFTRLFTEFAGCYPSDFRKAHKNNEDIADGDFSIIP